jgi:hypothetical protein
MRGPGPHRDERLRRLHDDDEIVATLEWAAGALLQTALQDFEAPA